jgi:hypothetical protein
MITVVQWIGTSFSTKGMRHVNIHEYAIWGARVLNEISIHHMPGASNPADLFYRRV